MIATGADDQAPIIARGEASPPAPGVAIRARYTPSGGLKMQYQYTGRCRWVSR